MRAIVVTAEGEPAQINEVAEDELLSGPVSIDVSYSSFNYKDGMALARGGIVRSWPLIAGIDLVGTVTASSAGPWRAGDVVVLNGDGLGERYHGGFAVLKLADSGLHQMLARY